MSTGSEASLNESDKLPTVLVVDDEESIRQSVEGVLQDEGFRVISVESGMAALNVIRSCRPDLILLDIWLPGMDGVETLGKLKEIYPEVPVIMISGHATIATAVKATRMGAVDFVEKPLDLEVLLGVIREVLEGGAGVKEESSIAVVPEETGGFSIGRVLDEDKIEPIVFRHQDLRGAKVTQKTLSHSALVYGQGLHSGKKSGLILEPLPHSSGIHFVGVSETTVVPAHVDFVESTGFATTLRLGDTQVGTIEHLMSALHAYGISNLLIKCNGEVPVLDGSSSELCTLIEDTGIEEQPGDWYAICPEDIIRLEHGKEYIQIEPAESFIVDYTLDYPEPLGRQQFVFELRDPADYRAEIASARTFAFVQDIEALQRQGLALGGRFDNFALIGPEGMINGELRFADEPARHKILDVIGDLYLLGRPLQGRVTAVMTGHADNIALLKELRVRLDGAL